MRACRFILLAASLAGCSFRFDSQSEVKYRRILAMQADPAEIIVTPGATLPPVKFSALVVDPKDAGASVQYEWRNCVESLGADGQWDSLQSRCFENPSTLMAQDGTGAPTSGSAPLANYGTAPVLLGLDSLVPLVAGDQVPAGVGASQVLAGFFGQAGRATPAISLWVDAMLKVGNGEKPALYGIKRVVISPNVPAGRTANQIPHLTGLLFDYKPWNPETPLTVKLGDCPDDKKVEIPNLDAGVGDPSTFKVCRHTITPVADPSQSENYTVQTLDKDSSGNWITLSLKERLRFQWQSDEGTLDNNETEQPDTYGLYDYDPISVHWNEPHNPTTTGGTVWLVVKDGRGGESWEVRKIAFSQ